VVSPRWEHHDVWVKVKSVVDNLSSYVSFKIAEDERFYDEEMGHMNVDSLYTLSGPFSTMIERACVRGVNEQRHQWDDGKYANYRFVRQTGSFPDVLLQNRDYPYNVIFGIELKGWYIFAKEGVPCFRYKISPSCCHPADFVAVVPWYLENIENGKFVTLPPYTEMAKYAAQYRNYHWMTRSTDSSTEIVSPTKAIWHPKHNERVSDKPVYDGGNNFGRFARSGVMDEWLKTFDETKIKDKTVAEWRKILYQRVKENGQ